MIDMRSRPVLAATLLVLLTRSLVAAPLAYRMPAGDKFDLTTQVEADVPMKGPIKMTVMAACQFEKPGVMKQTIRSSVPGKPEFVLSLGCTVSPDGRMSEFTGIDLTNPKMALVAKNASMGLPKLPDEEVQIGSSWEDERALSLPKMPIPGVPETARLHSTYKVTGFGRTPAGKDTVTIAMTMTESPGEKLKVAAKGTFVVEAATGKPVSSEFAGEASLRVVIKTFKIPFKVSVQAK
jgi:hypothetical protein